MGGGELGNVARGGEERARRGPRNQKGAGQQEGQAKHGGGEGEQKEEEKKRKKKGKKGRRGKKTKEKRQRGEKREA